MRWKDIPGYEGMYQVSDTGVVKSINYNRTGKTKIIKQHIARTGYPKVVLSKLNKQKTYLVHQLVLIAFVRPKKRGDVCRHLDGTRTNNKLNNLRWGTHSENHLDKRIHGTAGKFYSSLASLNRTHVLLSLGFSKRQTARLLNTTHTTINYWSKRI